MNQDDPEDMMEEATSKSQSLQTLAAGPFASSLGGLAASSRAIPSNKDFHFYHNFDEFKLPVRQIAAKSRTLLESIGSPARNPIFRQRMEFPADADADGDEAYDWLVNVNDELLERFDSSIDEFKRAREEEEEEQGSAHAARVSAASREGGFRVVMGRKKKGLVKGASVGGGSESVLGVKVADNKRGIVGAKPKVPFHIPTIRRPQDEFSILVNNTNQPFDHVWLQRSDDGSRFIHPLEKLSVLNFVDESTADYQPVPPLPLVSTPFKLVEDVKDLKDLAAKLRAVNEFAVDLEHNQYRSFQGLTCLMQISTRTEDFVVDTLKLRIHIGPYLREVFKDPAKKKVMHGADRDILWLQRDFGIYVCNLFDTGQASRVLKMERNSLEYLLNHFCGVAAKKEYQNADWRLRPLPDEMLRYAREDTHYLLYIYDSMRALLISKPKDAENSDPPLVEVYKRSYDVCMQLYEKEILTENSYLYLYGLQRAGFSAQQLAVVSGLFEWRDAVARAEDEGTGYILPNKTLLEIAKEMPVTTNKLRRLLKTKHPYVERHLDAVVCIIRHSMQHAEAFEAAALQLKEAALQLKENQTEVAPQEDLEVNDGCEANTHDSLAGLETTSVGTESIHGDNAMTESVSPYKAGNTQHKKNPTGQGSTVSDQIAGQGGSFKLHDENGEKAASFGGYRSGLSCGSPIAQQIRDKSANTDVSPVLKGTTVSVQVRKKPMGAFGALLGNAVAKRKFDTDKKVSDDIKLEKIRSEINLPFHSFSGKEESPQAVAVSDVPPPNRDKSFAHPAPSSMLEDIVPLDNNSDDEEVNNNDSETTYTDMGQNCAAGSDGERDKQDEPVSLSDLSASFQKCFQTNNGNRNNAHLKKTQEASGLFQLKPFDYAAARKEVIFGKHAVVESGTGDDKDERGRLSTTNRVKNSATDQVQNQDETLEFRQGRRRQAFPASGNRSVTFR
ncbi:hypothetical protein Tsubulata_021473 [Turnera subulata]|uniref:HRDC domain-containing protein n=1 Tax=Turnera subulata TaxID=218843 RepID=A0A9Q0FNS5_9ROSI|nr:hypothetical protein Tsubulata_021473 [Turnera subulata]